MNANLIKRAVELGINYSMFYLLPQKKRDKALAQEIARVEKQFVRAKARPGEDENA